MKVGETIKITKTAHWHECQECGMPAAFRITFLAGGNPRGNPASQAFRHDDCSYCADVERWACRKHERAVRADAPDGMTWCSTFPLAKHRSMGFYFMEVQG